MRAVTFTWSGWTKEPRNGCDMRTWMREGRMTYQETIMDGIDNAPAALIGLLQGQNTGKMLVRLAED